MKRILSSFPSERFIFFRFFDSVITALLSMIIFLMIFYVHCSYLFIKNRFRFCLISSNQAILLHCIRFHLKLRWVCWTKFFFSAFVSMSLKRQMFFNVHHHHKKTQKIGSIHSVILLLRSSVLASTAIIFVEVFLFTSFVYFFANGIFRWEYFSTTYSVLRPFINFLRKFLLPLVVF